MQENYNHKRITINPRVINHLGRDLITTSDVAVVELVKNSIDARGTQVNLMLFENEGYIYSTKHFITPLVKEVLEFVPKDCLEIPFLIIEDNGKGMNDKQLDQGFLEIGTSMKVDKSEGITLGEKGIGRLATQRLGKYLLVETASEEEDFATITFIDWNDITNSNSLSNGTNYFVPYKRIEKTLGSYTRLWIFDINITDFLDTPEQILLHFDDTNVVVNRNLKSAMNFLISPYSQEKQLAAINMFFNNITLNIDFPERMLNLSESTHFFEIKQNGAQFFLNYNLDLKPWYIERVHRILVKPEAFKRLKKSHSYYKELLEDNEDRIKKVLSKSLGELDLKELLIKTYEDLFSVGIKDATVRNGLAESKSEECISNLKKVLPINGEIYTFKQNTAIAQRIIIESLEEISGLKNQYNLKELKRFLEDYNGIKLYRKRYRIGFLGDKENDWLKLQQFRTKGQQWYRFDLGNTLGYVSITDPEQKNIKEISSRLDISQNEVSDAFKTLINIIFNKLFYELNRKSNSIIKVILEEKGLLGESLIKQVKKSTATIDNAIKRNKEMIKAVTKVSTQLKQNLRIEGDSALIPVKIYSEIEKIFEETAEHFAEDEKVQSQAVNLLAEADEHLRAIEVEGYNNYKLMANGLITETITHELHSISNTGVDSKIEHHFDSLKSYFIENRAIPIYNEHLHPIKTSHEIISRKINEVGSLYSFLENTFIKKGTYDEFNIQNINETITDIQQNLVKIMQDNKIIIDCNTEDLAWFVPKGVLVHVFYNLINNSIYWIDKRRTFAEVDSIYHSHKEDRIVIEEFNHDAIVFFDTGTGIIDKMEDILFEPLESGKPTGEGRGMGLYIVRKLLNSFNSDIELLPDRNAFGNRYKFLITIDTEELNQNGINTKL